MSMPRRGTRKGGRQMSGWKCTLGATMTCTVMLVLAGCVSQQKYDTLDARVIASF